MRETELISYGLLLAGVACASFSQVLLKSVFSCPADPQFPLCGFANGAE